VTIDTLRFDAVGFDGNSRSTTPNLDRVAAQGRVFGNAHAHNVLTLPSHTNILTGLYPYQHGVRDNSGFRLDRKLSTAATLLAARKYATGAFVAAFVLDSRYGLSRGFETYGELYRHVDVPLDFEIEQSRAEDVVAAALTWFRTANQPRFLWVHLYDPHAPYDPPEPFQQRFADDPYLGEVAYTDAALVPLLDAVTQTRPAPLLVVTADHGEARGDHGELTHGLFAYEPTLHVPLLIWCPDLVGPGRDEVSARHIDILTTILDAIGAPPEPTMAGTSLLAARRGTRPDSYFESLSANFNRGWAPLRGLLRGPEKYIDLPIAELYDLKADPAEKENLAASRTDDLRSLKRSLLEIPAGPTDPGPVGSEEAAKLRSLGYLSGGSSVRKESFGPEDDPKNRIAVDRQLHEFVQLVERGNREKALRLAREIVDANPRMRMGYEHLAFLLRDKGDLAQAVRVLERADANGVGGESLDCRRALLLSEMGRAREAAALLSPYRDSFDTETLNALGIALSDSGRGNEALATFSRIQELDPGNGLAYQNAGIALLKLDRASEARESLQRALAIHERNPRAWNALGVAWMRLSDPQKALEAWDKAVAYNPKQYDALYNQGLVAVRIGDKTRARRALERFVDTAPPSQYARDIAEARAALTALKKSS
jgi:arylsulfatase A-like enzyme/Flp pilus assembly protein TadD